MSEFCPLDERGGQRARLGCFGDTLSQRPGAPPEVFHLERGCGLRALLEPRLELMAGQPLEPPAHCQQRWSSHLERKLLDGSPRKPVGEDLAYHISEVVEIAAEEGREDGKCSLTLTAVEPLYRDGLESEAISVANVSPLVASPALHWPTALSAAGSGQQAL